MPDNARIDRQKCSAALKRLVQRHICDVGENTVGIPGVTLFRRDHASTGAPCLYQPRLIKMIQGDKRVTVGATEYRYGEDTLLVAGMDMPGVNMVCEATPEKPSIALTLDLDPALIAQLATQTADAHPAPEGEAAGLFVQPLDAAMLDALVRLAELFDRPDRAAVLAPMVLREIHYLLLTGQNGPALRAIHTLGSTSNQIARAIAWVKRNLAVAFDIETLAEKVHMAPSTFHRHFKDVTGLSPIQYQKRLRLHEAQRLMLAEGFDAGHACGAVGYESLSQFNREYKRLFGEPPRRDIVRLRRETPPRRAVFAALPGAIPGF